MCWLSVAANVDPYLSLKNNLKRKPKRTVTVPSSFTGHYYRKPSQVLPEPIATIIKKKINLYRKLIKTFEHKDEIEIVITLQILTNPKHNNFIPNLRSKELLRLPESRFDLMIERVVTVAGKIVGFLEERRLGTRKSVVVLYFMGFFTLNISLYSKPFIYHSMIYFM